MKMQARLAQCEVNIDRVLARLGLVGVAHQRVAVLSHGIRQRLGLAQAMLTEPEILLLDEPTLGLDVESAQEILNLLRRLASEAHVTILMSSHLMHEAEQICDRVAVLKEGALVACESTKALLSYDRSRLEVVMEGGGACRRSVCSNSLGCSQRGCVMVAYKYNYEGDNAHQLTSFLVSSGYPVGGVIPKTAHVAGVFAKGLESPGGAGVMGKRIWTAYQVEMGRLMRQKTFYIGPMLVLALILFAPVLHPLHRDGVSDYGFYSLCHPNDIGCIGVSAAFCFSVRL